MAVQTRLSRNDNIDHNKKLIHTDRHVSRYYYRVKNKREKKNKIYFFNVEGYENTPLDSDVHAPYASTHARLDHEKPDCRTLCSRSRCARAVDGSAGYEIDFEKIKTKKRRGTAVFAPPVTLMPTPRHGSLYVSVRISGVSISDLPAMCFKRLSKAPDLDHVAGHLPLVCKYGSVHRPRTYRSSISNGMTNH